MDEKEIVKALEAVAELVTRKFGDETMVNITFYDDHSGCITDGGVRLDEFDSFYELLELLTD